MRRIIVVSLTVAGMAVLALPAGAKGLVEAKLAGPGLPNGAIFLGHYPETYEALDSLGLYHTGNYLPPDELGITRNELGPRYTLTIRMDELTVREYVYPYAPDGVWTHPIPGHPFVGTLAPGWWRATDVFEFLVRHGLPTKRPSQTARTDQKTAGVADGTGGWPWLPIGIGLGVAGFATALIAGRRLRRTPA